eukprot:TRINITY_DN1916_c0_g1_i7.p2 TRINITY_DN1916_c0_g1~~TRINITY_DN1916_c0_g1_i7.p2  ORF type:complete len:193 (+),score=-5.52 TRINITY_DN1916_c0_g1_i7:65-643(+)
MVWDVKRFNQKILNLQWYIFCGLIFCGIVTNTLVARTWILSHLDGWRGDIVLINGENIQIRGGIYYHCCYYYWQVGNYSSILEKQKHQLSLKSNTTSFCIQFCKKIKRVILYFAQRFLFSMNSSALLLLICIQKKYNFVCLKEKCLQKTQIQVRSCMKIVTCYYQFVFKKSIILFVQKKNVFRKPKYKYVLV